ncbi:MAG: alpha/beta fold hydrolase [Desulfovibrionaceae bacterium]
MQCSYTYDEFQIHSGGVPVVLSVWARDSAATTLVFYPGTMSCPLYYQRFLQVLVDQGFNVVGLHPLSHGKSPRIKKIFTFEDILGNGRDTLTWAHAHFSGPVVLAGHSQGGILALAHACGPQNSPLAAVFLLCTLLPDHPRAIEVTLFKPLARWYKGLLRGICRLARLVPRAPICIPMYLSLFRICHGGKGADLSGGTVRFSYPLAFIASLFTTNLEKATQAGNITCPVDVITARNDALFTQDFMECLFAQLAARDKKMFIVSGGGHMAPLVPTYAAEIATHIGRRCAELGLPLHPLCSDAPPNTSVATSIV